jgi:hypothetical protein
MKEVKANRVGGPYMIQDSDHMSGQGQVGGEADSRQSEQSQGETRQQGGHRDSGGQQGGERTHKRNKR